MGQFNERAKTCIATTIDGGKPCPNPAQKNSDYCWQHDKSRNPERYGKIKWWEKLPPMMDLPSDEEKELMQMTMAALDEDFDLNESTDRMQAQMAAYYFTQWVMATKSRNLELAAAHDNLLQKNLKSLKATRDIRDGVEIKVSTPAEWAADLLEEYNSRQVAKKVDKTEVER